MVNRVGGFFKKEFSHTSEAALLLAGFSLFSQVLALLRDKILAYTFGAGLELDIYYASFRVPDLVYALVSSMLASVVLVPMVIGFIEREEKERAEIFLGAVFKFFSFFTIALSVILFFVMPSLVSFLVPGMGDEARETTTLLSRILLLSPFLLGLSNLFGSIAQINKHFALVAFAPVLYNVGIILGILIFFPIFGLEGLAVGVVLGALFHAGLQALGLRHTRVSLLFRSDVPRAPLFELIKTSFPRVLTLSMSQFVIFIFTALASTLAIGSISVFTFAFNLQSVPLALVGLSYSIAAFPGLAYLVARNDREGFVKEIESAVKQIIFWSISITVFFIVLRAHIVRVVLGSGAFNWADTKLVAAGLAIFVFSVIAQNLSLFFTRGYYALKDTKTPLILQGIASLAMLFLGAWFLYLFENIPFARHFFESLFRVEDVPGSAVLALPIAYSLGSVLGAILLGAGLMRKNFFSLKSILPSFYQASGAALLGGYATYILLGILSPVFGLSTFFGVLLPAFIAGSLGILVSIVFLALLDNEEWKSIVRALRHRFWKTEPLMPEQTEL